MSGNNHDEDNSRHTHEEVLTEEAIDNTSDTLSVLGHFYRGEVERMVGWRSRLDQTTSWAVVLMAAILTFSFSSEDNPQYVLLIGVLAVGAFLIMESYRYREYDAWRYRVRLLQRYFIADISDPEHATDTNWREHLAENLRNPEIPISRRKAIAHRLVHIYLLLFTVLIGAWTLRITVFDPNSTWLETASIGDIPGIMVVGIVGTIYLLMWVLALWLIFQAPIREFEEGPSSKIEE